MWQEGEMKIDLAASGTAGQGRKTELTNRAYLRNEDGKRIPKIRHAELVSASIA
jgi:hypothetical protein